MTSDDAAITDLSDRQHWGDNEYGQAPPGGVVGPFTAISANSRQTCALASSGDAVCWGQGTGDREKPSTYSGPLTSITTRSSSACGLTAMRDAVCWWTQPTESAPLGVVNGPFGPPWNMKPSVNAGDDVGGSEGTAVTLSGSAGDPDNDSLSVGWTYSAHAGVDAGATCAFSNASAAVTALTCTDDGVYTATLTASDGVYRPVSDTVTVTVTNAAPTITELTGPSGTVAGTAEVKLTATFTDAGANDTHICMVNWDDNDRLSERSPARPARRPTPTARRGTTSPR